MQSTKNIFLGKSISLEKLLLKDTSGQLRNGAVRIYGKIKDRTGPKKDEGITKERKIRKVCRW